MALAIDWHIITYHHGTAPHVGCSLRLGRAKTASYGAAYITRVSCVVAVNGTYYL